MKISVLIPVYNEERTLVNLFEKLSSLNIKYNKEIIFINDGSNDNSLNLIKGFIKKNENIILINSLKNYGKGFSIRKGIKKSKGDIVIFQDADLEYDVLDLKRILEEFKKEKVEVVYGSRFLKTNRKGNLLFYFANRILSLITSLFYYVKITDMETGYKAFRKEVLENLNLESFGFEIEPEITSKLLRKNYEIVEIPISYYPRSRKLGKKIKIRDGFLAVKTLIKYRFFK